ncbi:22852_t:CDS:1, partial [Racocetra persica]
MNVKYVNFILRIQDIIYYTFNIERKFGPQDTKDAENDECQLLWDYDNVTLMSMAESLENENERLSREIELLKKEN